MASETVYGVGPFISADIYADREVAVNTVIGYLKDEDWQGKLLPGHRRILRVLLLQTDDPELAIDYYNEHAPDGAKWYITECTVRNEAEQAGGE